MQKLEIEEKRPQHGREERQHQREEAESQSQFELEWTRLELGVEPCTLSHFLAQEDSAEYRLARNLKLVPVFEESKVTGWFWELEKKAHVFGWPRGGWMDLVANILKVNALEA